MICTTILKCVCLSYSQGYTQNYAQNYAQGYVTRQIGKMHLYNQKFEFQYTLNFNEYLHTSQLLNECIDNLKTICEKNKYESCDYFIENTNSFRANVNLNLSKFRTLKHKRELFTFTIILLGVLAMSLIAGISANLHTLQELKNEMKEGLKITQNALNETYKILKMQETLTNETNSAISIMNENFQNLTNRVNENYSFSNIVNIVLFSMIKYNYYQAKLDLIYRNRVNSRLFEIIDFHNLTRSINFVNQKILNQSSFIPQPPHFSQMEFIRTSTNANDTHLMLSVQLPILYNTQFDLMELIPIPTTEMNATFILNIPTTIFYRNNSKFYDLNAMNSDTNFCTKQDKLTICNSLILSNLLEVSGCITQLVSNQPETNCSYTEIRHGNYFTKISDNLLFASLITPIDVVTQCSNRETISNLNSNQFIQMENDCTLFELSKTRLKSPKLKVLDEFLSISRPNISFQTHGFIRNLTKIPILSTHDKAFNTSYINIHKINENIDTNMKRIDNIRIENSLLTWFEDKWTDLKNYLSNTILRYALICGAALVAIALCLKIIKCICANICNNSSRNSQ